MLNLLLLSMLGSINWFTTRLTIVSNPPTPRTFELTLWAINFIVRSTDSAFWRPSRRATSRRGQNGVILRFRSFFIRNNGGWGMDRVPVDIRKIERDDRLLIRLFVCLNGKDRLDVALWVIFLTKYDWDSMPTWITGRLPDGTGAGMLYKVDNVIATSFHRFDFVEDTGNRRHRTVPASSIVGDDLKVVGRLCN